MPDFSQPFVLEYRRLPDMDWCSPYAERAPNRISQQVLVPQEPNALDIREGVLDYPAWCEKWLKEQASLLQQFGVNDTTRTKLIVYFSMNRFENDNTRSSSMEELGDQKDTTTSEKHPGGSTAGVQR